MEAATAVPPERRSAKSECRGSCDPLRPFLINIPTDQSCRATLLAAHRPRQWPRKAPEKALAAISASAHRTSCSRSRARQAAAHATDPSSSTVPPSPRAHRMRSLMQHTRAKVAFSRGHPTAARPAHPIRRVPCDQPTWTGCTSKVHSSHFSGPSVPRAPSRLQNPSPRWAGGRNAEAFRADAA